jgi:hypothetical protein
MRGHTVTRTVWRKPIMVAAGMTVWDTHRGVMEGPTSSIGALGWRTGYNGAQSVDTLKDIRSWGGHRMATTSAARGARMRVRGITRANPSSRRDAGARVSQLAAVAIEHP